MAVEFVTSEVTQYIVVFNVRNRKLLVYLTEDAGDWVFKIKQPEGEPPFEELFADELVEICNFIYEKVIHENAMIEIRHKYGNICIEGKERVTADILNTFRVEFPESSDDE